MLIYLAARYSRRFELRFCRVRLERLGHAVTSRWIDTDWTPVPGDAAAHAPPAERARVAIEDLEDISVCDTLVAFTEQPGAERSGRGGRHVEFGIALALKKRLYLVGPPENVFHYLPGVIIFPTAEELCQHLSGPVYPQVKS
jgi:hypothetical protein